MYFEVSCAHNVIDNSYKILKKIPGLGKGA